MTPETLAKATGSTPEIAGKYLPYIETYTEAYQINTQERMAAFLATVGHESGGLRYAKEIWGPTPAQMRYEGRKDLGNTQSGDGKKYLGRGLIQITGRYNYYATHNRIKHRFGDRNIPNFINNPEELEKKRWAVLSACDFWNANHLNTIADGHSFDHVSDVVNFGKATATIGDSNGWPDRLALYNVASNLELLA